MSIRPQLPPKPFHLPLSQAAFQAALQRGQGRALLHVEHFGGEGLAEIIVDACVHHRAYDPQCEGSRASWLLQVADAAEMEESVVAAVVEALELPQGADRFWDLVQLCELARLFAQRGHRAARQALYESLAMNEDSTDMIAAEDIVRLDGADGLLHVVRTLGAWMAEDESIEVDEEPLAIYDEMHGKGAARRILQAATADASISFYLRQLEQLELQRRCREAAGAQTTRRHLAGWPADQIIEHIQSADSDRHRYLLGRWGREATPAQLQAVCEAMSAVPQLTDLRKYLWVFRRRPMPILDPRLFELAEQADRSLRAEAMDVLSHHCDERVRDFAIRRLAQGEVFDMELRLLRHNYRQGDHLLIEQSLQLPEDSFDLHLLGADVLDVAEHNRIPEMKTAVLFVYEYSPCSWCRQGAVSWLVQANLLDQWIWAECKHDACPEVQAAVAADT